MTTPLEREILAHYYCSDAPYTCRSDVHIRAVDAFVKLGLLISDEQGVRANRYALEPYMRALDNVPLPVQRWVVSDVIGIKREGEKT